MSMLERQLLLQIRAMRLPEPELEAKIIEGRKFRMDMAWWPQKLAVEVQGGTWVKSGHTTGRGIKRDCEKSCLAAALGWRVMPVTADHIRSGAAIGWIEKALGGTRHAQRDLEKRA